MREQEHCCAEFERDYPTEGRLQLSLDRRAPYFQSFPVSRNAVDAIVVRQQKRIAGFAALNRIEVCQKRGRASASLAYVSSMRILPKHRRGAAFRSGFHQLAQLLETKPVDYLLGFVMEDNREAQSLLLGKGRSSFGAIDLGEYRTHLVQRIPRTFRRGSGRAKVQVRFATELDVDRILTFLRQAGEEKPLFPRLERSDLLGGGRFNGLHVSQFTLAERAGELLGCLALWSQQHYREWVVQRYRSMPEMVRRLYNLWARATGSFALPKPGSGLGYCYASFCHLLPGCEWVLEELLAAALAQLDAATLVIGLHESDRLRSVVDRWSTKTLRSRMLLLSLEGRPSLAQFPSGVPHFEVGLL